ncbi:TIGR03943 family protein [Lacrimispora sp.]|uniref:TIGR03943 family putative permease subunit n=1 Tax=Lacrimispora sp. TaxID=2719234 RepID=UPI0032E4BD53
MKLKGKGINVQALTECACYLLFGILLFRLTVTGGYLSYVTPRMKPYLYGLSALMVLWAVMGAGKIFRPRYKGRMFHCLVLGIPILILAVPPAPPAGSAAIKNYSSSSIPGSDSKGSPIDYGSTSEQETAGFDYYEDETEEEQTDYSAGNAGNGDDGQQAQNKQPDLLKGAGLNGIDENAKTITIADDDYYAWMTELGAHADKYQGYTVTMKGFVFLDLENRQEHEFALVRLSMWCCSADMAPMGLMADDLKGLGFKENNWITVTGKLLVKDGYPTIEAENIVAAEKPEQEYVYPYY